MTIHYRLLYYGDVISENIFNHLEEAAEGEDRLEVVFAATREVGGAVLTAVLTTVVGFLPVFAMEGAEGKLFVPLALTKTRSEAAPPVASTLLAPRARSPPLWVCGGGWSMWSC